MIYKELVETFINGWNFTRSETIEILNSLSDQQLQFKPKGKEWQPLYWEFGCIGRTQIVYSEAVRTGKMDFSLFGSPRLPKKTDYQGQKSILKFLSETNKGWLGAIKKRISEKNFLIEWLDVKMSLVRFIASLAEHERLHHGQFISYFTLAGFDLPKDFKSNWAL